MIGEVVCYGCGQAPKITSVTNAIIIECKCGLYRRDGVSENHAISLWRKRYSGTNAKL